VTSACVLQKRVKSCAFQAGECKIEGKERSGDCDVGKVGKMGGESGISSCRSSILTRVDEWYKILCEIDLWSIRAWHMHGEGERYRVELS
jgi:hypothetical protein